MKLTYRGVSYEYNPPAVEFPEGEGVLGGKYRGQDWRFCNQHKPLVQQSTVELIYRGVVYTTGSEPAPVLSVPEKARRLQLDRQRTAVNRQRSLLYRSAAEVGLAF